jgi:hypothetical protein
MLKKRKALNSNENRNKIKSEDYLFPKDIWFYILDYIPEYTINLSQVSKYFRNLCRDFIDHEIYLKKWDWAIGKSFHLSGKYSEKQIKILKNLFLTMIESQELKMDLNIHSALPFKIKSNYRGYVNKILMFYVNEKPSNIIIPLCKKNLKLIIAYQMQSSFYDTDYILKLFWSKILNENKLIFPNINLNEKEQKEIFICISMCITIGKFENKKLFQCFLDSFNNLKL